MTTPTTNLRLLIGMPDPESLGGPAACEPPFVAELRKQGALVEEETYVYGDKLSHTSSARRVNRVLAAAFRLRSKLRSGNYDLLHLNSSFDGRALLRDVVTLAIIGRRTKVFIKFHGSDGDLLKTQHPMMKHFVGRLLTRVDGIGLLSTEEKQNFVSAGWPAHKIFVVKNVIERSFPARDETFNRRHAVSDQTPTLLFIGRLIPAKGLLDVIAACGILRDRGIQFVLFCVGDGPVRADAEAEVRTLALNDCVRFIGFVPEEATAQFYANCSLLVFPTYHYEGFPMTVFYASAAGMPIITTRIRGAAEYLKEQENCLWTEPKNPSMLAEKIAMLLNDAEVRSTMSETNKQLVANFSPAVVTRDYLDAYNQIVSAAVAGRHELHSAPAGRQTRK
ncbi:MAG: glycosyltransferase family 4 protein [Pyrinomonadaceae bacterium]